MEQLPPRVLALPQDRDLYDGQVGEMPLQRGRAPTPLLRGIHDVPLRGVRFEIPCLRFEIPRQLPCFRTARARSARCGLRGWPHLCSPRAFLFYFKNNGALTARFDPLVAVADKLRMEL